MKTRSTVFRVGDEPNERGGGCLTDLGQTRVKKMKRRLWMTRMGLLETGDAQTLLLRDGSRMKGGDARLG